jgi:hypothetical protein
MGRFVYSLMLISLTVGCAPRGYFDLHSGGKPPMVPQLCPNPGLVPAYDRDYVWDQIVDVTDDYFEIAREDRVRLVGDVLIEGRIVTRPVTGATLLEPHRDDSVGIYNRWESTLQTIRRLGVIRVIPTEGGYFVEVIVNKELEDRTKPDQSPASDATFFPEIVPTVVSAPRVLEDTAELGWISQGRDPALEQKILNEIHGRLGNGLGARR